MNKSIILCGIAALGLSACVQEKSTLDMAPGQYENVTRSTNSSGTKTVNRETTTVGVDAYGNKTAVIENKKTTDPRGLLNKSTSESTTVIREDD